MHQILFGEPVFEVSFSMTAEAAGDNVGWHSSFGFGSATPSSPSVPIGRTVIAVYDDLFSGFTFVVFDGQPAEFFTVLDLYVDGSLVGTLIQNPAQKQTFRVSPEAAGFLDATAYTIRLVLR